MASEEQIYAALARQTFDTAGRIHLLAETMEAASFHADGWPPAALRDLAATLRGTAMRAAMAAGDTDLLNEITGRAWKRLDPGVDHEEP